MHEYAQQCSMKIHANLIVLQEEMTKQSNSNMDESAFVALAGLKQVNSLFITKSVNCFYENVSYSQKVRDLLHPSFDYGSFDDKLSKPKLNETNSQTQDESNTTLNQFNSEA